MIVGVMLTSMLSLQLASADNLAFESYFCDGIARSGTGEGSTSQVSVHTDVFAPAVANNCPSEAGLVNYIGTGDRAGVNALTARTRSFSASDSPLTPVEKAQMETGKKYFSMVHQVPIYVDGWAIVYNVPCASTGAINLPSSVLSLIYLGVTNKWNDPSISSIPGNGWLATCNESIRLTKRADSAGATRVIQDYMSKRNPEWVPYRRGIAPQIWPTLNFACSGMGEAGMVNCVKSFRGAIGYVRMSVAAANGLSVASVENVTGSYVAPSAASCGAAATSAVLPPGLASYQIPATTEGVPRKTPVLPATLGDWSTVSMTDAPDSVGGPKSYPICSFSYVFILQQWYGGYGGNVGGNVGRAVVDYFTVALRDDVQTRLTDIGLAPLPSNVRQISRDGVNSVSVFNFTPIEGWLAGN